jgi:site-specific DNA recombinase
MTTENVYAAYIRKSSDEGHINTSLEHQLKACLRYADANGLAVYENLIFQENYTGTVIDRPGLNKLRKLTRNRMITGVIVFSSDRLSRNPTDADTLLREFFNNEVELHLTTHGLLENTPETWLIWGIEAQFNSYWHNKIITATTNGKHAKMERGIPIGSGRMKYGYRLVGPRNGEYLEEVPEETALIKDVFNNLVFERRSVQEIVDMFNDLKVPTRSMAKHGGFIARRWTDRMIYQIINDTSYIGYFYINRFGSNNVPKDPSERIRVNCPAIISEEVWKEAQIILEQGRNRSARNSKHYEYLVANRAQCRHCGYAILGKPSKTRNGSIHLRYQCTMREKRLWQNFRGEKCDLPTITARRVDDAVRSWLISLLENPRAILASYQEAQKEVDSQLEEALETIRQYEEVIASYEDELKSYAELYAEKAITKAIFYEKKNLLDQKVADAKTHKLDYEDKLSERRITDKEITTAVRYAEMVRAKLAYNEEITFALLRKAIEDLDITFEFAVEDEHFVVYIYWTVYEYRLPIDRGENDQATRSKIMRS